MTIEQELADAVILTSEEYTRALELAYHHGLSVGRYHDKWRTSKAFLLGSLAGSSVTLAIVALAWAVTR